MRNSFFPRGLAKQAEQPAIKVVTVSVALLALWPFANPITADAKPITEAEKRHCEQAYHKYCGEYGLESDALRNCMSRNGRVATCVHRSSHRCWRGLAERGRTSKKERQIIVDFRYFSRLAALFPRWAAFGIPHLAQKLGGYASLGTP